MFPGTHVILEIVGRTVVIYLIVLLGVRLSGKREVGQMTPFDLTLLLLPISSFWSTLGARTPPTTPVLIAQITIAVAVLGTAWWRAAPYRAERRKFEAEMTAPVTEPES